MANPKTRVLCASVATPNLSVLCVSVAILKGLCVLRASVANPKNL